MNSEYKALATTFLFICCCHINRRDAINISAVNQLLTTEHPIIISLQPRRQNYVLTLFLRDIQLEHLF